MKDHEYVQLPFLEWKTTFTPALYNLSCKSTSSYAIFRKSSLIISIDSRSFLFTIIFPPAHNEIVFFGEIHRCPSFV